MTIEGGVGGRVEAELAAGEIRTWRVEFPAEALRKFNRPDPSGRERGRR